MNGWNLSGQSRRCVTRTASTPLLFPTTSSPHSPSSECTHTRQPLTSSMCTTRPFTAPTKYGRALLNVGASYNRHNIPTGSPRNMCCWQHCLLMLLALVTQLPACFNQMRVQRVPNPFLTDSRPPLYNTALFTRLSR